MSKMTCRNGFIFVAAMCLGLMTMSARGGSLDSPSAPTDPASALHTAQDLYDRLATGTNAPKRAGAFTEPSAGPTAGTMPTTDEIMAKAPATNAAGAVAGEVLSGKTFWGLTQGAWGMRTGTMANVGKQDVTPGTTAQTITQGYHDGTGSVAGDTDLTAGNIKKDVAIFGVTGTYEGAGGAGVPKTGQTTSYADYDDGWYGTNVGLAWPNPRFAAVAESGSETNQIRDNLTGLIWARNANLDGTKTWANAITYCEALTYGGTNDWRLPNRFELESLLDLGRSDPALPSGHPFTGVQSGYWSSTTYAFGADFAWFVGMFNGGPAHNMRFVEYSVWPVRGGQ